MTHCYFPNVLEIKYFVVMGRIVTETNLLLASTIEFSWCVCLCLGPRSCLLINQQGCAIRLINKTRQVGRSTRSHRSVNKQGRAGRLLAAHDASNCSSTTR